MRLTHGIHRAARQRPGATALVCADRRLDWRGFRDTVARMAAVLRAHGVGTDDRVALLGLNGDDYVLALFATLWAGAVVVPLNTRWSDAELAFALDDCAPRVLLADPSHRARALAGARGPILLGLRDPEGEGAGTDAPVPDPEVPELMALARAAAPVADADRGDGALAALYYTGGTTGRSKGVMLSHRNLVANALTAMINMDIRPHSVHLHVAPLFHVAGGARLFSVTLAGGTHVVQPRFEPEAFCDLIAREGVTITVVVPTMLNRLGRMPGLGDGRLETLDLLCYGASPMPEALLRALVEALPRVRFLQSYGMTELAPVATVLAPEYHVFEGPRAGRTRSVGLPVYNVDVAIHDPADRPLPPGEIGEVVVRGPNVMEGYWGLPELTARTLRGGWLHTGDAGYLDEDGFLFLVDRVKDMIVSGGENVYSVEVENALHAHPEVLECAVIAVPHPEWGEAVHAEVVRAPGAALDDEALRAALDAHCRAHIAAYKVPRSWAFRSAELPKSGPGKILKAALRAPYWEGRERGIQ